MADGTESSPVVLHTCWRCPVPTPKSLPDQIGSFSILSILGEGGMGIVYLAEQTEPVRRSVALKVLSQADASAEILARFAAERQALAVMDHPSIAKVFDAGTTEDGRPYFVMEVVEGSTIVQFCNDRKMGIRDRVALFADVCKAVQHAHQKGVIHRDLKPSNVMVSEVDGWPLPRVIDFGIAKAVEPDEFDGAGLTRKDQVIGTPAYTSPEQILESADVDTRSDVYSLGVLLYELLVGSLPFDPESYRGWASVAATLHRDPPTLVRRLTELAQEAETLAGQRGTTSSLLLKELTGDLEWIVSRAMEKERDHRYETANGLALDLERFLADEPVRARTTGTAYRIRKFVRRNRIGVGVGLAAGLGLVVFAGAMAVQADRVARARDEAETRQEQAEGLIDFMLGELRDELEPIGRLDILAGVGEQALGYFSTLPQEFFSDDELQSRSQALYQVGKVREDQGSFPEALAAYEESLRLAKALAERDPDDPGRLFGLSQSHFYVGWAGWSMGDLETAEDEFQAYLTLAERLVED
ncbi:MAG: serine/threonine protein kinase, partial [Gemmatimonadetes bacterium]|nr:serine/threonine protein kinase [Gemmatimonadota bacterium]